MSHIFISYCHKNRNKLDAFIARLESEGFHKDEYWFDDSIEAGNRWRFDIDNALDDSFAIVVLVSPESMKSYYVTYEWSWGIGSGKAILPILIKGNHDILHPRLKDDIHCPDGTQNIPDNVINKLKELKNISSFSWILGKSIGTIISPFIILTRTAFAVFHFSKVINFEKFPNLLEKTRYETVALYQQKLPNFWLDHSCAFSYKQKKTFNELIFKLEEFFEILRLTSFSNGFIFEEKVSQAEQYFFQSLDPLFNALNATPAYEEFDRYIENLSKTDITQQSLEHLRFFSPFLDAVLKSLDQEDLELVNNLLEQIKQTHPVE